MRILERGVGSKAQLKIFHSVANDINKQGRGVYPKWLFGSDKVLQVSILEKALRFFLCSDLQ